MKVQIRGGSVTLRDKLPFREAAAVRYSIVTRRAELVDEDGQLPNDAIPDLMAAISEAMILRGVEGWTFKDPVTRASIRRLILDEDDRATLVGAAVDGLYSEQVISPLALLASPSSPPSPTDDSTSAPTELSSPSHTPPGNHESSTPSPKRQRRSKPSSTSTTSTGVTVMTSA